MLEGQQSDLPRLLRGISASLQDTAALIGCTARKFRDDRLEAQLATAMLGDDRLDGCCARRGVPPYEAVNGAPLFQMRLRMLCDHGKKCCALKCTSLRFAGGYAMCTRPWVGSVQAATSDSPKQELQIPQVSVVDLLTTPGLDHPEWSTTNRTTAKSGRVARVVGGSEGRNGASLQETRS